MTQYYHIDESGDPGLVSGKKSSAYFVIAMVQLPSREVIPQLVDLREAFHLPPDFEFHYKKMSIRQKVGFFESIANFPYRVRAIYLDKASFFLAGQPPDSADLIVEMITRLVLRASPLDITDDVLILDAAPPSIRTKLRIRLSEDCHRLERPRLFKKIISADSSNEEGLQLADMVAGAIRQYVMHEEDRFFLAIGKRVVDLVRFD